MRSIRIYAGLYLDVVTCHGTSIGRLLFANLVIMFVFGLAYSWMIMGANSLPAPCQNLVGIGFAHAVFTFVELSPGPPQWDDLAKVTTPPHFTALQPFPYYVLLFAEIALAYLHLSILISMLYQRITRHSP